jgi:hypothetical protein
VVFWTTLDVSAGGGEDWGNFLKVKGLGYNGDVVERAEPLSLARVLPGLPPAHLCASIDVLELADGGLKTFLEHPEDSVMPDSPECECPKAGKINIVAGESAGLLDKLTELKLLAWLPADQILQAGGRPCLNGLFGVPKSGDKLPDGSSQLTLIMNLTASNSRQISWQSDMGLLPNSCQWKQIYLGKGRSSTGMRRT